MEFGMTKKQLERYKKKLLAAKEEVLNRVQRTETYGREVGSKDEAMDLADKASSSYTKEFLFSLSNSDRKLLQMIDEALNRIEKGTYGSCQHTGEPIEAKRLDAVPWARLCVKAQELEEQGQLEA
jgi:DnaK suppressor protein